MDFLNSSKQEQIASTNNKAIASVNPLDLVTSDSFELTSTKTLVNSESLASANTPLDDRVITQVPEPSKPDQLSIYAKSTDSTSVSGDMDSTEDDSKLSMQSKLPEKYSDAETTGVFSTSTSTSSKSQSSIFSSSSTLARILMPPSSSTKNLENTSNTASPGTGTIGAPIAPQTASAAVISKGRISAEGNIDLKLKSKKDGSTRSGGSLHKGTRESSTPHRSRKEKLVARCLGTDEDSMVHSRFRKHALKKNKEPGQVPERPKRKYRRRIPKSLHESGALKNLMGQEYAVLKDAIKPADFSSGLDKNSEIDLEPAADYFNFSIEELLRNQCPYDSDDDFSVPKKISSENKDYDLLSKAKYMTTEEVLAVHLSKLEKLKHLYKEYIKSLKQEYIINRMKYKRRALELSYDPNNASTSDPDVLCHSVGEFSKRFVFEQRRLASRNKAILNNKRPIGETINLIAKAEEIHKKGRHRKKTLRMINPDENEEIGPFSGSNEETDSDSDSDLDHMIGIDTWNTESYEKSDTADQKKCDYMDTCSNSALPFSSFCKKHIVHDEQQKLFAACNRPTSGEDRCMEPVIPKIEKNGCPLHLLPHLQEFKDIKLESAIKELYNDSTAPEISNEETVKLMEDLIVEEINDVNHFDQVVNKIISKGLMMSDSSDSTDDEEQN